MSSTTHRLRWFLALVAAALALTVTGAGPAQASSYVPLIGDGSSWAQPAISQWSRDVNGRGITVDFSGDGSAAGRQHYVTNQADFAASDIAFLTTGDPFGGGLESSAYAYSYVPIVAGGTAFMYNLVVGGRHVHNMRLSGLTLAKIFTGKITNWDDAAITHDYGAKLPSQKITVVTRSDGSGASYMFSQWLNKDYHSLWYPFCKARGGAGACGPTEFYPQFAGSVQRNGSDQVASYVSSPSFGPGSIGYDEYAYALNNNIPVVKVLNQAGYYSLPTPSNVAIALQAAVIDENPTSVTFLMQKLDDVYVNPDPRTYPLSSYSYLIIPRTSRVYKGSKQGPPPRFSTDKGRTLSTWMNYVLCGAQQKAGALGYSPLPKNLVVGGFNQVKQMPGAVGVPDLQKLNGCNNPTYSNGVNHLVKDAPRPSPCDKVGSPLNCVVSNGRARKVAGNAITGSSGAQGPNGGGAVGTNGAAGRGGGTGTNGAATGSGRGGTVDPVTGQAVTASADGSGQLAAESVSLASHTSQNWLLSALTALDIIAAVVLPGLFGAWLRRRRRATP